MAKKKKLQQQQLKGMKPAVIKELEKLCGAWRDAVAEHKEATENVTEAKKAVRVYMSENNIPEYCYQGRGTVKFEDEKDRDIVWKAVKRTEKTTEE